MIDHLRVGQSAYFYQRKRRFSNESIDTLFRTLRAQAREPSRNLFRIDRERLGRGRYSGICFSHERTPSFLAQDSRVTERVFVYLLIVEHGPYIAVFKSGVDLPSNFRSTYLSKISGERIERAIAQHDAVFEKIRLRNMSISPLALRTKSLEARDLQNAVATSSASRFIPQGYSVRQNGGLYSATPNTGRISVRADRGGIEDAVRWAIQISERLEDEHPDPSGFIRAFARPIDLSAIPAGVHPTFAGFDTMGLADALSSGEEGLRLVRRGNDGAEELSEYEASTILAALEPNFPIVAEDGKYFIRSGNGDASIAEVRVSKTRIAIRSLKIPELSGISVERRVFAPGEDPDAVPLPRFVDREDLFTVLFTDPALAYIDGTLFRDEALTNGGASLLARIQVSASLEQCTSEKGNFAQGQTSFSQRSVFGSVIDDIARDDDVLLCDDLGDEWADFIGIRADTNPPMISFYHAKHGGHSLSASAFHVSVSQAIKNLGRMSLPPDVMPRKLERWRERYRSDGIQTEIPRMIRGGTPEDVAAKISIAGASPDAILRANIVTSSLSRKDVQDTLTSIATGGSPTPHFVQLYWLLMSYFSACSEMGIRGYVICRP